MERDKVRTQHDMKTKDQVLLFLEANTRPRDLTHSSFSFSSLIKDLHIALKYRWPIRTPMIESWSKENVFFPVLFLKTDWWFCKQCCWWEAFQFPMDFLFVYSVSPGQKTIVWKGHRVSERCLQNLVYRRSRKHLRFYDILRNLKLNLKFQ